MASINHSLSRENKINKRRNSMRIDNRNIFILEEEKRKKAEEIKKAREERRLEKEKELDDH
jgi:hypothetical protein